MGMDNNGETAKGATVYVATYTSRGKSDFGVPKVLGLFTAEEAAREAVNADIRDFEDIGMLVDYGLMQSENCVWNVEKAVVQ